MNTKNLKWVFSFIPFIIFTLVFSSSAFSQKLSSRIVSTQWLQGNLTKEDMRIIDIRPSINNYWEGHIPGAVYFHLETVRLSEHGVPGKLMPPKIIAAILGKMGIDRKTQVVVYSKGNDFMATYLIWALDYIKHSDVVMLEGGFEKWKEEEGEITQDYPKIKSRKYRLPSKLNQEVRASLKEVKEAVDKGEVIILDNRSPAMYSGEKGSWKRKGHIKGAINHFVGEDFDEDGSWKSKDELKESYERLGVTPDKNIIVYCGQGMMSSISYFVLKHILEYPKIEQYDGSFSEWSNIEELPVETGTE